MNNKATAYTILTCIFCVCFIIDSFLELKVISIYGIEFTAGLLVIALSYIVNDCLVELYGLKHTQIAIGLTFLLHLFVVGLFQVSCLLPAIPWDGEEHFQYIFSMSPRITIASIIAFIVGSNTNAYVMTKMKRVDGKDKFKLRAFVSTVYGEFVDTFTFYPIAFLGVLPVTIILKIAFIQAVCKILIELSVLPVTSRLVRRLEVL